MVGALWANLKLDFLNPYILLSTLHQQKEPFLPCLKRKFPFLWRIFSDFVEDYWSFLGPTLTPWGKPFIVSKIINRLKKGKIPIVELQGQLFRVLNKMMLSSLDNYSLLRITSDLLLGPCTRWVLSHQPFYDNVTWTVPQGVDTFSCTKSGSGHARNTALSHRYAMSSSRSVVSWMNKQCECPCPLPLLCCSVALNVLILPHRKLPMTSDRGRKK